MSEVYAWWPVSESEAHDPANQDSAFTDGALLAAHAAKRTAELTPVEQARLAAILELQHDEAFTQPED